MPRFGRSARLIHVYLLDSCRCLAALSLPHLHAGKVGGLHTNRADSGQAGAPMHVWRAQSVDFEWCSPLLRWRQRRR